VSGADAQGELNAGAPPLVDDARVLDALSQPDAYPHDASARKIAWIQTHLSHVFLSGERVYKFRKPVNLSFVDFTTRAARNADCLREVALNRRLAPDVYLGVAPLEQHGRAVRVGSANEELTSDEIEHCVVMRRLPEGRDALSLLVRGALSPEQIDRVARRLARFHAHQTLGAPAPYAESKWLQHCTRPVWANFDALRAHLRDAGDLSQVQQLEEAARDFVRRNASWFEGRRQAGRAVDGHGDLHLQHVWFERDDAEPIAIDCLEFDTELRRIDAASEVAFLAMDLRYRGADALAERFLRTYATERDDFDLYRGLAWFESYRAAVRAKVAVIAASEAEIDADQRMRAADSTKRHLAQALAVLESRRQPALVLVGGAVGTGKSTLAALLAEALGGVVVASDRVRKHLLGLDASARAPESAYGEDAKRRVYHALLERADPVIASGRVAILDASFGSQRERTRAHAWASARRLPAWFVETRCAPQEAEARLTARARAGRDASDAGPALHAASRAGFEPPQEWPAARRRAVDTDAAGWRDAVRALAEELRPTTASRDEAACHVPG
jgi:aminoglycoside phosphotransferase family enzyme/predicted kinase